MIFKLIKKKISKIFFLIIMASCTKKTTKIDFKDLNIHTKDKNLIITSISAKESRDFYEYNIRIPKVLLNSEKEDESLQEFNTEINDYVGGILSRLKKISSEEKIKDKKSSLDIKYEIYHGYNVYSIILIATQNIKDTPITNYRTYYIRDDGKYLYNIDDIMDTNSAFPFFISEIKNSINNALSFDLQQAAIYFKNKNIIIKFPDYTLNDSKNPTEFEFKEEEVLKYIKQEYKRG